MHLSRGQSSKLKLLFSRYVWQTKLAAHQFFSTR